MIVWSIWAARFHTNIIKKLPDISEIENFSFKQTSTIVDRNGEVLFKLFDENRRYIGFDQISEHFINGLVATEDQRFWANPGVDRKGTLRAWITDITQWKMHWWSTLTQQIIKNILLTPEKKIERKLKEMILALRLWWHIKNDIKTLYPNLGKEELDQKTKERIIEIYSNLVFFGNNAYWVEAAALTYFDKNASDLTILEAAILAWLPQSPSRYNVYTNRWIVMWTLHITDSQHWTPVEVTPELQAAVLEKIETNISESRFTFRRSDSAVLEFMRWLLSFKITFEWQTYQVNYSQWRKDIVLARMYEEWYISEDEFKEAFIDAFTYEFNHGRIEIKAPHFVFWIRELLEEKYDTEILQREWLTITTTLDYEIQKMAEESIREHEQQLINFSAGNSAMLYLNSTNWDVIAYVWSRDYNNSWISGQVDMIRARRQPWSSIKPFVFALWFMRLPLTIDSPIYDIPMLIDNNTPQNADWSFEWLTSIKRALAASRNIPTIKMFLAAWWEWPLKSMLYDMWIESLIMEQNHYWYPLSLWAAEISMLELWKAYMHLSTFGKPPTINPILEIRSADWSILFRRQTTYENEVIPAWVAYLIRDILSDKWNLPSSWVNNFNYPGITFAIKSWTSNVVRWESILPRDWRLAAYTPERVLINWSWNTDWSAMRRDAFWWWLNAPIRRSFMRKVEQHGDIQNNIPQQRDVRSVSISTISWKLASAETPLAFTQQSIGYINSLPTQVDNHVTSIDIDMLCRWLPSELTPEEDIQRAFIINPESILPDRRDQEDILERWREEGLEIMANELDEIILLEEISWVCEERELIAEMWEISIEIMHPMSGENIARDFSLRHQARSPFIISTLRVFLWNIELRSIDYNRAWTITDIVSIKIPDEIPTWTYPLRIVVSDDKWFTETKEIQIRLINNDENPPLFLADRLRISEKDNGYEITLLFRDNESRVTSWSITRWEELLHTVNNEISVFTVESLEEIEYTVSDIAWNIATWEIVLQR